MLCMRSASLKRVKPLHVSLSSNLWSQLLRFQVEAHGEFTRKRQSEKITKIVWFYQGWALQMGAGLDKNIQWSQSVQIWGCQRPLRLLKWDWRSRKSRHQRSEFFSLCESTEEKSPESQDRIPELFLGFLGAVTCHGVKWSQDRIPVLLGAATCHGAKWSQDRIPFLLGTESCHGAKCGDKVLH